VKFIELSGLVFVTADWAIVLKDVDDKAWEITVPPYDVPILDVVKVYELL
tara:strand:- start:4 stop:153 length:150 start_codon:yes stop_codon:yes gene_type:complete